MIWPRSVMKTMSEANTYPANDDAYEQLVAYLDGELDAESSRQLETRLAEDASYRRELQQLQRAWDMLDELPCAEVSESFTQTTVEIVALSAEHDLELAKTREQRQLRRWQWLSIGGMVAASLAGYLAVSRWLDRPNEQLVRDLPVIENVDLFRVADNVDFLHKLDDEGLFSEEVDGDL